MYTNQSIDQGECHKECHGAAEDISLPHNAEDTRTSMWKFVIYLHGKEVHVHNK